MRHEASAPLALKDCWDEFENLLRIIETLFGDLFDAPRLILRTAARRVEAWLRDGEAVARALLLAMASTMTVVMPPRAKHAQRTQLTKRQWRFGFVARITCTGKPGVRYALSPEQKRRLEEARHEERYQRRMFGRDPKPQRETINARAKCAPLAPLPPRPSASPWVDRAGVVRRYNGLIHVMRNREKFAARLARRLARNREGAIACTIRRRALRQGGKPSPCHWLVIESQAHAPRPRGADDG